MSVLRGRGTVVALAAVDLVLVVVLVLLAVRAAAGGSTPVASPGGSTAGQGFSASSASPGVAASGDVVDFVMPSGNVACRMTADAVTCVIDQVATAPAAATATCTGGTAGHVVLLDAGGVSMPCDATATPTAAGAQKLAYGTTARAGGYVCVSAENGVSCTGADGTGFRLARSGVSLLP